MPGEGFEPSRGCPQGILRTIDGVTQVALRDPFIGKPPVRVPRRPYVTLPFVTELSPNPTPWVDTYSRSTLRQRGERGEHAPPGVFAGLAH